ncbi:MAG: bis-aminopropyl spermidine synthase family protein [Myxococcota bacterium]
MRRLADGIYFVVGGSGSGGTLRSLRGDVSLPVAESDTAEVARLAHGVPDNESPVTACFAQLQRAGLAVEGATAVDDEIKARLRWLGRGFGWALEHDHRAPALLEALTRAHARRKLFVRAHGQTPCLPESAARRCLVVADRLPSGAKVLVLGDDDLLGVGLATLGFTVTSVDIDPLLIDFLVRLADEEELSLSARVLDLLQPLAHSDVEAFDAVITDPMSYEDCLLAFVSRALSFVPEGGLVFSCVNPVGRGTWLRVLPRLPARVLHTDAQLSAYYLPEYIENSYRSDLVTMVRTQGALPFGPHDAIPLSAITEGSLAVYEHGSLVVRGIRSHTRGSVSEAEVRESLMHAFGAAQVRVHSSSDGRYVHAGVARGQEGAVTVVLDLHRTTLALVGFPSLRGELERLTEGPLSSLFRPLRRETVYVSSLRVPPWPLAASDETS